MKLLTGFLLGVIFKNKFLCLSLKVVSTSISKFHQLKPRPVKKPIQKIYGMELVIDITDKVYFKNLYPKIKNVESHKITFNQEIINYINNNLPNLEITLKTICDLNLDEYSIDHLSRIGTLHLYIHYTDYLKHFTNVYGLSDPILENDFIFSEKSFYQKYRSIICATLVDDKNKYITCQFKKYFNQPDNSVKLTPKILFNTKSKLILLNSKVTKTIENLEVI